MAAYSGSTLVTKIDCLKNLDLIQSYIRSVSVQATNVDNCSRATESIPYLTINSYVNSIATIPFVSKAKLNLKAFSFLIF